MYLLPDDMEVVLTPVPEDKRGNPIDLASLNGETFTVTSSNPEIATAALNPDNTVLVVPVGPLGTTQISLQMVIPAAPPASPLTLIGTFDIQVVGGAVAQLTIQPGAVTPIPK